MKPIVLRKMTHLTVNYIFCNIAQKLFMNFWLRILDDNIESASQVSGPRPIAPYDPPTSRSALNQIDSERF